MKCEEGLREVQRREQCQPAGTMAQKEMISRHRLKMKIWYSRPVVWTGWEEGQRQTSLQRGRTSGILVPHFMAKEDEKVTSSRNPKYPSHSSNLRDGSRGTKNLLPPPSMQWAQSEKG